MRDESSRPLFVHGRAPSEAPPAEIRSVLEVVAVLRADPALRVLEIGSGRGGVTLALARAGAQVLAVEPDPLGAAALRGVLEAAGPGASQGVEVLVDGPCGLALTERFRAVVLPAAGLTRLARPEQLDLLEEASALLAPGGSLIVSTEHVTLTRARTTTVDLDDGGRYTEVVDPARGLRRAVLTGSGPRTVQEVHSAPPAWISARLRALGLEVDYQHSVPDPVLRGHAAVVIAATAPARR
ncbi:class I SAM-dependent methyltransferase [Actinomyces radicidentis]|uniref:class I SAM-dependent methyltransferase n=1 Tax=Actinomyces radicidentis TaxID=111015 RepID=UPI0034A03B2F